MVVEHHATHLWGNFEGLKMTVAILKTKVLCLSVCLSGFRVYLIGGFISIFGWGLGAG